MSKPLPIFIHTADDDRFVVLMVAGVEVARHRRDTAAAAAILELNDAIRARESIVA